MKVAIDFGITNTDVIIDRDPHEFHSLSSNSLNSSKEETISETLKSLKVTDSIEKIFVTGGKSASLPSRYKDTEIIKVAEIDAIAAGAKQLFDLNQNALIVSAGTGTACVWLNESKYTHLGGIAVGGGTFEGLGKLLTGNGNGLELNEFGIKGDRKKIDLLINDVVTELGSLPGDITAVNFGNTKELGLDTMENVSASLGNMIGEIIGTTAALYAHILQLQDVYFVGRTANLSLIKEGINSRLALSSLNGYFHENGGYANALGALNFDQS
jgi:type II pantothenate kinase